ncbi:hypothetical protein ACYZUD_10745 [Pseudomonas sp. XS1P51]
MPLYLRLSACVLSVLLPMLLAVSSAQAEVKNCECEFNSRDYQAYGTRGACGVFMYDKASICEISFAGTGANPEVLDSMLGTGTQQAQLDVSPDIFSRYLEFVRTGDTKRLSEREFIERSLPVLARASLFRAAPQIAEAPIKQLDALVQDLARKYSGELEAVFLGEKEPRTLKWDSESDVEIGRGYVQINYKKDVRLRVLYFSQAQR